jgi:hypothetical protein
MTTDEALGRILAELGGLSRRVDTLTGEVRGLRARLDDAVAAGRMTDRQVAALGVEIAAAARGSGARAGGGVAAVVAAAIAAVGHALR